MSLLARTALLLSLLAAPGLASAEVGGLHLDVTPFGGYGVWAKEVNLANRGMFGGRVGIGFGRHVALEGSYGWMKTHTIYGNGDSLFAAASQTPSTQQSVRLYGVDLVLNLMPKSGFNPYVLGGWHEEKIVATGTSQRTFMSGPEVGGGFKLGMGEKTALRLEIRDKLWEFSSPPTPTPPGERRLHNLFVSAGIQFSIGGSTTDKDADLDGVPDRLDQCPNTPAGTLVDSHGCPLDSDGDGVLDGADRCPNTPLGTKVDANGCPIVLDSDGDGVLDNIDQCPNTPAGTQVDAKGCPLVVDSDGDGVADDKDLCPYTPAGIKVDSDGCPITLTDRETELLDKGSITTREIHFDTAKWDILPESRVVLDDIGGTLIQWPRLRIEVGGHTDARGSVAYNQDLSQKRAQAVLDYLLQKFPNIERVQYVAKGYGEGVPVASNKTVEGMAKNRRVEFKVLNVEELTKERARRHMLRKGE
ncbi:MAG: OmpA family protein [Candidatus Eisenbacteria bacterium]